MKIQNENVNSNEQNSNEVINENIQVDNDQTNGLENKPKIDNKKATGSAYYKELLEKERAERELLSKELEASRNEELKRNNQWKELYESERIKREESEIKVKNISANVVDNLMIREIEKAALQAGILSEALDDLQIFDKSMIEVETTSSGRINFHNVNEWVDSLKQKKPYLFKTGRAPNINTSQPGIAKPKEYTPSELLELQRKDIRAYNEIMKKRFSL